MSSLLHRLCYSPLSDFHFFLIGLLLFIHSYAYSVQFSSVAQSCPTLCDRMNHSTLGLPSITNSWSLPKLMPIELVMPSSHLIFYRPLLLPPSIFPSIRVFSNEKLFTSDGQSIGVSASTSVLPMKTQD